MIGTPGMSAVIQDATAIETFVMVVINNYAAASNTRCFTQIKFAVTNGGVFSMEKRSTTPGTLDKWSQWEYVGGGSSSSNSLINEPNTSNSSSLVLGGAALNLRLSTHSGDWDIIAKSDYLSFSNNNSNLECYIGKDGLAIGSDYEGGGGISIGNNVKIGEIISIGDRVHIGGGILIHSLGESTRGIFIGTDTYGPGLEIKIDLDTSKIIFSYNNKSAELPLT